MNIVALPWPNRYLSPNARVHHMVKSKVSREHRAFAKVLATRAEFKTLKNPVLCIQPIVVTRHRRDIDNVIAGLKASLDGLTDADWWDDDSNICGITIRKPLYIRGWNDAEIIIAADEWHNESYLLARMKNFATDAQSNHDVAWNALIMLRPTNE